MTRSKDTVTPNNRRYVPQDDTVGGYFKPSAQERAAIRRGDTVIARAVAAANKRELHKLQVSIG